MKGPKLKMFIYDETLMFLELILGMCVFDRYSIVQIWFISSDSLLMSILLISCDFRLIYDSLDLH